MTQKKTKTEIFIEKARKIHGDKYDYSKAEYINAKTKICIICPKHGEFWQTCANHINCHKNCPKCGRESAAKKINLTTEEFVQRAKKKHGDKYDYSKVNYINCRIKVPIICPKHGEFKQTPFDHLQNHGCPKCSFESQKNKRRMGKEKFIEKARQIHGDKYDYSKVNYVNAYTKVCIICPIHGEFWQAPTTHLSGSGCLQCGMTSTMNKIRKWTISKALEVAKSFRTRTELGKSYPQAYEVLRRNNLLDECFINIRDNDERIHIVYRYYFPLTNSIYIGRTLQGRKNMRDREHHTQHYDSVYKHAIETKQPIPQMQVIEWNLTLKESLEKEHEFVEEYRNNGYSILNKAKTGVKSGSVGTINKGYLNKQYCYKCAKECTTIKELQEKYQTVYKKARRENWFQDYVWLRYLIKPKHYWDDFDRVQKEAKKYKCVRDFSINNSSAYQSARRNNWIDILFPNKRKTNKTKHEN